MAAPDVCVDPHLHLWDVHKNPREQTPLVRLLGWNRALLEAVAKLAFPRDLLEFVGEKTHALEDYLPAHYVADAAPSGVRRYVHVQAGWRDRSPLDPVGETEWLEGLRRAGAAGLSGIVAYADLAMGAGVDVVLDAHREASPLVRGVRYMLAHHPHPLVHDWAPSADITKDPRWRRGFAALVEAGLSYDAWCYHRQLPAVAALAKDFPDARIVLCHLGTPVGAGGPYADLGASPPARERIRAEWRDGISEVASYPNVSCKISGLAMPVLGFGYHQRATPPDADELAEALEPFVRHAIEAFGVDRCMFASNFPIDKVSCDYTSMWSAFSRITDELELGEGACQALFHDNAVEFYGL